MAASNLEELARQFWLRVPADDRQPLRFRAAVSWALPLAIVELPGLDGTSLGLWLQRRGLSDLLPHPNRELRACLLASQGSGVVFLDGTDVEAEQRFSLAHEVAHFILDYDLPRSTAIRACGPNIREVLDGERLPTPAERLAGALRGVPVTAYSHLMARESDGYTRSADVRAREDRADLFALALLAPTDKATALLANSSPSWYANEQIGYAASLLAEAFLLPVEVALRYARYLGARHVKRPSVREWLYGEGT